MESNVLERERFLSPQREYVPFNVPSYILQWAGLTAELAATHVPGEQLVQPSHAQELQDDMQTKMEIFIVLFGSWDKWLVLSHFHFDKGVNYFKDHKVKIMTSHLKAKYVVCCVFPVN